MEAAKPAAGLQGSLWKSLLLTQWRQLACAWLSKLGFLAAIFSAPLLLQQLVAAVERGASRGASPGVAGTAQERMSSKTGHGEGSFPRPCK